MIKQSGSVYAKGSDGKEYRINIFTEFANEHSSSGTTIAQGYSFLKTSDGRRVERVTKGRYRIPGIPPVLPVIELISDDPNAP